MHARASLTAAAILVLPASTDYCSGINAACTAVEGRLTRHAAGGRIVPVCSPFPNGATCGTRLHAGLSPKCVKGICTGEPDAGSSNAALPPGITVARCRSRARRAAATSQPRPHAGSDKRRLLPPALPVRPMPSAVQLAGNTRIAHLPNAAAPRGGGWRRRGGTAVPAGRMSLQLDVLKLGPPLPPDFLGISLEWGGIQYYGGKQIDAWARVLRPLGRGAIIRLGGASQDKLTDVPGRASWDAMAQLHKHAGTRFIIGLPLAGGNVTLMRAMMAMAWRRLPPAALAGFELGNEPSYWECTGAVRAIMLGVGLVWGGCLLACASVGSCKNASAHCMPPACACTQCTIAAACCRMMRRAAGTSTAFSRLAGRRIWRCTTGLRAY